MLSRFLLEKRKRGKENQNGAISLSPLPLPPPHGQGAATEKKKAGQRKPEPGGPSGRRKVCQYSAKLVFFPVAIFLCEMFMTHDVMEAIEVGMGRRFIMEGHE